MTSFNSAARLVFQRGKPGAGACPLQRRHSTIKNATLSAEPSPPANTMKGRLVRLAWTPPPHRGDAWSDCDGMALWKTFKVLRWSAEAIMARVLELLRRLNPGALATLTLIFAGLIAGGADESARAALLSFSLLVLLLIAVALSPTARLSRIAATHWLAGSAAILFFVWTLVTAAPLQSDFLVNRLGHPLWERFASWPPSISISPYVTIEGLASFLGPVAAFALGALSSSDRKSRDQAGRWIGVLTIFYAIYALNDFFAHGANTSGRLNAQIGSANAAAAVFGTLALLVSALIVRAGNGRLEGTASTLHHRLGWAAGFIKAPFSSVAVILALTCAVLTSSRGGLFATGIGFLAFVSFLALRRFSPSGSARGFFFAPVIGVIAIGAWLLLRRSGPLVDRFADTTAAAEGRRQLLEPAWQAFLSRPLLGNGFNTYHELNSMAATPENWAALSYAGAAHNVFVQALEENGIVGSCLLVLMIAPPLWNALRRALFGATGVEWAAAIVSVATLLLLHGTIDFELQIPAVAALFGFSLGAFTGPAE